MTDNIDVTPGAGKTIGADDVGGVFYQKIKLDAGGDGVSVPVIAGRQADSASVPVALSTENAALIGSLTETAPASDTASSGHNGRLQRIAQRITSLITALGSPFQAGGSIGNTTFASTVANGANAVEGSTTGAKVITDADGTIQQYLRGIVYYILTYFLPRLDPANFVNGTITTAMTGTTSTSLVAAPASGLRNYITQITVSNAHATVGTDVEILDGSGGTVMYTIPAAAVYGGAALTFPTPLRQPTTATAIHARNVTTGASVKVSASGYKGA